MCSIPRVVCHVGALIGTETLELHGLGSGLASAHVNRGWSLFSHESQLLWTLNNNLGTQWGLSTEVLAGCQGPFRSRRASQAVSHRLLPPDPDPSKGYS